MAALAWVQPSHCCGAGRAVPHEVIDDQHPAAFEHVLKRNRPLCSLDRERLHGGHGEATAGGGEGIAGVCVFFLTDEQFCAGRAPIPRG